MFYTESPESDLDSSNQKNESHVSGVSPFMSAEDINVSFLRDKEINVNIFHIIVYSLQ